MPFSKKRSDSINTFDWILLDLFWANISEQRMQFAADWDVNLARRDLRLCLMCVHTSS